MSNGEQESWSRVKERLRAEVGDDVYSSWFARMEPESIDGDTVKLSVPTRFLKSWVQSHYAEKLLGCWQSELPAIMRIELTVRSAVIRSMVAKTKPAEIPSARHEPRDGRINGTEFRPAAAPMPRHPLRDTPSPASRE